jgi:glycosyltransferase involved in cell wall biosynthesis
LLRSHEVILYAIGSPLPGGTNTRVQDLHGLEERLFRIPPRGYAWNAVKGIFSRLPLQVKLYESRALARALSDDVGRGCVDLLLVQLLRMAEYVLPLSDVPRILDMVDSICLHYHRMPPIWHSPRWLAARLDRGRVCRYEAEMPGRFRRILLSSPIDLAALRQRTAAENLVLLPNGVDLEEFPFYEGRVDTNRIAFVGKLDSLPNSDAAAYFAKDILPLVMKSVPDAHLVIVGWNPPRSVQALARFPNVTVRANVPDVRTELAKCAVSVAPLRFGAGTQYKILESLALGVPVVATPIAALPFASETEGPILVGRDAADFAERIIQVLRDGPYRERLRREGRALVESQYAWERVLNPVDEILEELQVQRAAP